MYSTKFVGVIIKNRTRLSVKSWWELGLVF